MPIPRMTVKLYTTRSQQFAAHWGAVNTALGGTPATEMKLKGAYAVAGFTTDRAAILAQNVTVTNADNAAELASADLDIKKAAAKVRLKQFNAAVTGLLTDTPYLNALPKQPNFGVIESRFLQPFDDMLSLWTTLNADLTTPGWTAPLLLAGGYTLAAFTTELTALKAQFTANNNARTAASRTRDTRIALINVSYLRMKQYRTVVVSRLDPANALLQSIPAITPPPGSTPDPVGNIVVIWDAAQSKGKIDFTASPSANLATYELRTCIGSTYRTQDETVVTSILSNASLLQFLTNVGLTTSGASRLFRIYAITDDGNEKGSPNIRITRP